MRDRKETNRPKRCRRAAVWSSSGKEEVAGGIPMGPSVIEAIAKKHGITAGQASQLNERRGVSREMLEAMPDDVLRRTLGRLQYHDLPRLRQASWRSQALDENGQVPS